MPLDIDEVVGSVRAKLSDPPWDDLRAERVLGRVTASLAAPGLLQAERPHQGRRRLIAALSLAAAVVLGAGLARMFWARGQTVIISRSAVPMTGPSTLALRDGSQVFLSPGTRVVVEEQSAASVRLNQSIGEALYDIHPDATRVLQVQAGAATVEVLGTRFRVTVAPDGTTVRVERGRVRVSNRQRNAILAAGDELKLSISPDPDSSEVASSRPAGETPSVSDAGVLRTAYHRPKAAPAAPVEAMLAKADRARAEGRGDDAAEAFHELLAQHPHDPRTATILFSLGRVEADRGHYADAAAAFTRSFQKTPRGPLAGSALAEACKAWRQAGKPIAARDAARRYLGLFPSGKHAGEMNDALR